MEVTARSTYDHAWKDEMRRKNLEDSKSGSFKPKYGLFSFTGSLAISDDSIGQPTKPRRDPDGSVKLGPRNFYTSPSKRGNSVDVYFSKPEFNTIGDPYKPPHKRTIKSSTDNIKRPTEAPFKLGSEYKPVAAPYEYIPSPPQAKISRKLSDGSVATGPKNFLTSPPKKGNPLQTSQGGGFNSNTTYISEHYDRVKEMHRDEIRKHNEKSNGPFKTYSSGGNTFNPDKSVYNSIDGVPAKKEKPKSPKQKIEKPFYPSSPPKQGIIERTFSKPNEYISDPISFPVRKSEPEKAPWKTTTTFITKPSPSVATLATNLKSEMPAIRHYI
jgi:hypothetical protein